MWHIGEGEELHSLEQEQADQDNHEELNDNNYEDTAKYIGGIKESHLTIGHIRQAKSLLHKRKSKSLLGKKTTHTTSWNDHSKSFQQFPKKR